MSQGVLLFAFNSEMDYVKLAIKSAERVKKYLNLPVTLITDSLDYLKKTYPESMLLFDKIIKSKDTTTQTKKFLDGHQASNRFVWKNSNRSDAYTLSPYNQTLVLDVDYVLNSSFLKFCFYQDKEFLIYKDSLDLSGWRNSSEFKFLNQYSVPFYWATVFYFTKTNTNQLFFKLVEYIKQNWNYYRLIYQINDKKYRNDYAFSIAIHILNGTDSELFDNIIPGKMFYTLDKDILLNLKNGSATFLVEKENKLGEYTGCTIKGTDVHIMNKFSLLRAYDE